MAQGHENAAAAQTPGSQPVEGVGQGAEEPSAAPVRKAVSLVLGVLFAVLVAGVMPDDVSRAAQLTAAVATLMAVWWMTEPIPIAATALVPLVVMPPLGITDMTGAAAPYAAETVFLLMGGYMLGQAMQKWNLHRRLALIILLTVGTNPLRLVAGFMIATAFITMWVSNAATTLMMLPIGLSVLMKIRELNAGRLEKNFATALMLAIAYAATIGGISSLIGAAPNALLAAYLTEQHDIRVTFLDWLMFGGPIAVVFLAIAWVLLTRVVFRIREVDVSGSSEVIRGELTDMGPTSRGEKVVVVVFCFAALSWVFVPLLADTAWVGDALPWLSNVTDAGIAMTVGLVLLIVPVEPRRDVQALDWNSAAKLPWGMLILVGGGLSLSEQVTDSGLAEWIGTQASELEVLPVLAIIVVLSAAMILLTELTSNTATAATFIPIMGGVALGIDVNVMLLVLPVGLAVQMAFMLPVATPPNAMAYGTGYVTMGQLIRGGTTLNIAGLVIIVAAMYTIAAWTFGVAV